MIAELTELLAPAMPVFMAVAAVGGVAIGWLAKKVVVRVLVEKVRRMSRTVRVLTEQLDTAELDLAEERALVDQITSGTDDIITAARGAHHRTQEEADRG